MIPGVEILPARCSCFHLQPLWKEPLHYRTHRSPLLANFRAGPYITPVGHFHATYHIADADSSTEPIICKLCGAIACLYRNQVVRSIPLIYGRRIGVWIGRCKFVQSVKKELSSGSVKLFCHAVSGKVVGIAEGLQYVPILRCDGRRELIGPVVAER